jgi:general stress protein CsbA
VALIGALLLVVVLLVRPQEFIPALQSLSVLNAVAALAALGIALELALGKKSSLWTPQLPWLAGFVGWCFLVTVRRLGREGLVVAWEFVGLSAVFMVVVAFAIRTTAHWRAIAASLVVVAVLIAATCTHQSTQQAECIAIDTSSVGGERSGEGVSDGRSCDNAFVCENGGKAHTAYACEKIGLFGTFTEGRRVRWRGTLGDPNELALLLGTTMPLVFAFAASSTKKGWATIAATVVLGVMLVCVVLTGSRGGQLVVTTVFGVYFVRRYGFRGALAGALLALPVLLFGGRSGEEAESSSLERIDLLYEGMDMIRAYPVLGVGAGQFVDHAWNGITAHNSYVLAAAELGLPGSLLWTMLVYASMKIPWVVATRPPPGVDPGFRALAFALCVAFAGMLVGVFFLSFCYKAVLFIFFGLSAAMYRVVRNACPDFELVVSPKEIARVAVADAAILAFVLLYSHVKGAHA